MVVRERCIEFIFMLIFYGFVIFFLRRGVEGDMVMVGIEVKDGGRFGLGLCFFGF